MSRRNPRLSIAWKVGMAGVAAQGVTFGFARYGYGLFLPEIRRQFDLSVSLVGVIGSATYVSYLIALLLVGVLSTRWGPRPWSSAAACRRRRACSLWRTHTGPGC